MAQSDFNLLEYYAAHRASIALLRDPNALFALGFLDSVGPTPRAALQTDLGVTAVELDATVEKLYNAGFVATQGTTITVTPAGHQFLLDVGLLGPLPPPPPPDRTKPEPPKDSSARPAPKPVPAGTPWLLYLLVAALILGALAVFGIIVPRLGGGSPTETKLPPVTALVANTATPFPTDAPDDDSSPTIRFAANPPILGPNECVTLQWQVTDAREVYLNARRVEPSGRTSDCPTQTTDYILTVITQGNEKLTETRTVTVPAPNGATDYEWTLVTNDDPFTNAAFKGALAYGIDEAAITKAVLRGRGEFRAADSAANAAPYSVDRARALLEQMKYAEQPVVIVPHSDPMSQQLAKFMANYLSRLDIPFILNDTLDAKTTITIGPVP